MTKQEILDLIAGLLDHPGWKVSSGSSEPRKALTDIADCIGVPTSPYESKRSIAKSIVESWGLDWYPTHESAGETITRIGLEAILSAVKLAIEPASSPTISEVNDGNTLGESGSDDFRCIQLGESYKFPDHINSHPDLEFIDGSKNWFFYSDARSSELRGLRPQAGIWNPRMVRTVEKKDRVPFIFCTTYPNRAGTFDTPWHDKIDLNEGRALYFGDNKDPDFIDPALVRGNRVMLENQQLQHSLLRSDRELAAPVLLVEAHGSGGKAYGFRTPLGLGVIWKSDVVTQKTHDSAAKFLNLRFELIILDLSLDSDLIDMRWVHSRRDHKVNLIECNKFAPQAWSQFVEEGIQCLPRLQKRDISTSN